MSHSYSVWVHDPEFHAQGEWACTAEVDYQRQAVMLATAEVDLKPVVGVRVYKRMGPDSYRLDWQKPAGRDKTAGFVHHNPPTSVDAMLDAKAALTRTQQEARANSAALFPRGVPAA